MSPDDWLKCEWCHKLHYSPARAWLCADCWTCVVYYVAGIVFGIGCLIGYWSVS